MLFTQHLSAVSKDHFASASLLLLMISNSRIQTQSAVSAAHFLLQSAEAALPKQKKNVAVTEFKHAMVAHKRCCKTHQVEKGQIIFKKWLCYITEKAKEVMFKKFPFLVFQVHSNCHKIFLYTFSVFQICNLWSRRGQSAGNTILLLCELYIFDRFVEHVKLLYLIIFCLHCLAH